LALFQNGQRRDNNPAVAALVDETRQVVLTVLDHLQDDQRMLLEWKYADDLTVREIADRTGRSRKSIESLLHRARVAFRQKYELRTKSRMGPGTMDRNQAS
jgi:RNA polymerase sigma factor (sigma-70 family)